MTNDLVPIQPENETKETSMSNVLANFIDHQVKAAQETGRALDALIPPDFKTHSAEARKEFLLSFQVLVEGVASAVDGELEKVRKSVTGASGSTPGSASSGPAS